MGKFDISLLPSGDALTLKFVGRSRFEAAESLKSALLASRPKANVALDWENAEHVDGCVLQVLLALQLSLNRRGLRVCVARDNPKVRDYLRRAGLSAYFPLLQSGGERQCRSGDRVEDQRRKICLIHFSPSSEVFRKGMDPLLILRELSRLGKAEPVVRLSSLPALEALESSTCYLAWDVCLLTAKTKAEIEDVFEFVEYGAQIRIALYEGPGFAAAATE